MPPTMLTQMLRSRDRAQIDSPETRASSPHLFSCRALPEEAELLCYHDARDARCQGNTEPRRVGMRAGLDDFSRSIPALQLYDSTSDGSVDILLAPPLCGY
ncbi:unnamed protein product [Caretta caretta]